MGIDVELAPSAAVADPVRGVRRLVAAFTIAVPAFFRHRGTQLAAAISYRVLFSLVPFLALALSLLDLVLSAESESRLDQWIAGLVPGDSELEESLSRMLASTGAAASVAGLVALIGLLWSASGMASTVRTALATVWEEERPRPYLRAKLVDLALVFLGVALVLTAFVANLALQLLTSYGAELAEWLGLDRIDARLLGSLGQTIVVLGITVLALLAVYRLAPNGPSVRELLPGAIVGAVAVHLAVVGFSLYVGLMTSFEEIYGTLGSIFGFLFLVYLVAGAIVLGAELVAAWPDAARAREPSGPPLPLAARLRGAARGLVSRPRNP